MAYLVLLIALLLTLLAWRYVSLDVEEQNRARFEQTVSATQNSVEQITASYIDTMFGARSLFYSSRSVERDEWAEYVGGLDPGERLKGFQALGYSEHVTPSERRAFVERTRNQGLPDLTPGIEASGERSAYFPVVYVGPSNKANAGMINEDLYADSPHRRAMNRARDTGSAQATRMIYVLTETNDNSSADLALRPGFAAYLPVYKEGERTDTVARRQRALDGFVVGTFKMDGLLEGVFRDSFEPGIDLEVYDGKNVAESRLLYNEDGIKSATNPRQDSLFARETRIEISGRQWTLYFSTLEDFEENAESNLPTFVLTSGIVVSLLLFGITWLLIRSRTRAEYMSESLKNTNRRLEGVNKELEAFSYSVSHDLRAPLRTIDGFSRILLEDYERSLDKEGRDYLGRVRNASQHMGYLIDDLLNLSRVTRSPLRREEVNLSELVSGVARELRESDPDREAEFTIKKDVTDWGDDSLLLVALKNLLGNAWKFTRNEPVARIEFGVREGHSNHPADTVYYIRDNGAGFDMTYADKLFGAFQRLHGAQEFEGTGIGLATVQRIVHRHGGRVWAEGAVGKGATFYFTLGGQHSGTEKVEQEKMELA